jgi:hypothetical protein
MLFQTSNYPLVALLHLYHLSGSVASRLPGFCEHWQPSRSNGRPAAKCNSRAKTNTTSLILGLLNFGQVTLSHPLFSRAFGASYRRGPGNSYPLPRTTCFRSCMKAMITLASGTTPAHQRHRHSANNILPSPESNLRSSNLPSHGSRHIQCVGEIRETVQDPPVTEI